MIISNTSPLRYLIAVDQVNLLQQLFEEVLIAPAVLNEPSHPSARQDVRQWIEQRPDWLRVRQLSRPPAEALVATLDAGESETIELALEINPNFVLIDERLGRKTASSLGLTVIGALGVLREGYRQRYVSEPLQVLNQMRSVGFRISQSLYRDFQEDIRTLESA